MRYNKSFVNQLHRLIVVVLVLIMLVGLLPLSSPIAFADEEPLSSETTSLSKTIPIQTTYQSDPSETVIPSETAASTIFVEESAPPVTTTASSSAPPTTPSAIPESSEPTPFESESEPSASFAFKETMSFSVMNAMAETSSSIELNDTVDVSFFIDHNTPFTQAITTGLIAENYPHLDGKIFKGAFVVTAQGEDEIAYIGSYTDTDDIVYVYYAFEEDASTGILLKPGQIIKLVYKSEVTINYQIKRDTITGVDVPDGGIFAYADTITSVGRGENVNVRFNATKRAPSEGDSYQLKKLYVISASGAVNEVSLDSTGSGKVNSVADDITFCAVVEKVTTYKLIVDKQNRGHVCWAGYDGENNSNPGNPYGVNPALFCSYDGNGSRTGTSGATVMAAPGGTIYFVMYSEADSKWQFQYLMINGIYIDAIADGTLYTQNVQGMTVHFRFLGEAKDSHLKSGASSNRRKFECWVTNVREDIHVDFSCESNLRETLTLVKADGIEKVVASSFDRTYYWPKVAYVNFWDVIYSNAQLGPNDLGQDLVNEFWNNSTARGGHQQSNNGHTAVETKTTLTGLSKSYGSRYVYFKASPGYDPTTLSALLTGHAGNLSVGYVADLMSDTTGGIFGLITTETNKSLGQAKTAGYQYFIYYEGVGIDFRNLSLSCDPYNFAAIYDLDGGSLVGASQYTDSLTYSIHAGANRIVLPVVEPVKDGYLFNGWKLIPTNIDPRFANLNLVYNAADRFAINNTTFEYGLETELKGTGTNAAYIVKENGNHHFKFVAQWQAKEDQTSPKAKYTVTMYKEVDADTEDAILFNGKAYQPYGEVIERLGVKGETIIGIPSRAPEGYVFNEDSIIRLPNFMSDGNTDDALIYYYERIHSLTISKVLTGAYAIKTKVFTVQLSLFDASGNPIQDGFKCTGSDATIWGGIAGQTSGIIQFTNGQSTILLKDGQHITIEGIKTGTYSVVEPPVSGHVTTYIVDGATPSETAPVAVPVVASNLDELSVLIHNVKLDIPVTGIDTGVDMPALWLFLVVLVGGIVALWQKMRRLRRVQRAQ